MGQCPSCGQEEKTDSITANIVAVADCIFAYPTDQQRRVFIAAMAQLCDNLISKCR